MLGRIKRGSERVSEAGSRNRRRDHNGGFQYTAAWSSEIAFADAVEEALEDRAATNSGPTGMSVNKILHLS